jgi:hypothetical protein
MAEQSSRRTFLQHVSLGTAAVGATVLVPATVAHAASARTAHNASTRTAAPVGAVRHQGPLTAYVKDARTGEIAVMVGEREVLHRDLELAATLSRIAATQS